MANIIRDDDYDTSIATGERSVVSATKTWGIVLAVIALLGVIMIAMLLSRTSMSPSSGPVSSDNTAARPAEP